MEMRANSHLDMAEDLIPPLLPLAVALHDRFLRSHCSSCFLPLPRSPVCLSCCPASLGYCSTQCLRSDAVRHLSSGECRLLQHHLLDAEHAATDIRVALRLLHCFEQSGVLHRRRPGRIGGLLAVDGSRAGEGWEMARKVKEGGEMMANVRESMDAAEVAEAVLWVVVTNGVEVVQIGGGRGEALGVAVYGVMFSWLNHSCSPNACYRFEMGGMDGDDNGLPGFRVRPHESEKGAVDALRSWIDDETRLNLESCRFGPRIIVRSIRPIGKNEEICITYTDLVLPKASRHLDLWENYHFVCCCCRCAAVPENFVDRMLSNHAANCIDEPLNAYDHIQNDAQQELADSLDEAIAEYLSDGDPKICCEKIETLFTKPSQGVFKLHPLQHISINAYIALSSTYKVRMENSLFARDLSGSRNSEGYNMSRAATSYSLLLAGISNYLFSYEVALIGTAATFWINAGESLLTLVNISASNSGASSANISERLTLTSHSHFVDSAEKILTKQAVFVSTCMGILSCIMELCFRVWPTLAAGFPGLEDIKNPVDFSWVGSTKDPSVIRRPDPSCDSGSSYEQVHEDRKILYELAFHCMEYGCYLAKYCYGSRCPLIMSIGNAVGKFPPFYI